MNGPKRKGNWGDPVAEAREKCEARRARVLAHPDIAARLTKRPINYPTPEHWTGYIPSNEIPTGGGYKPNESPMRLALLAICQAVIDRENQLALDEEGESNTVVQG